MERIRLLEMNFIDKKTIQIDRKLSDLDRFTLSFTHILEDYTSYVIISGYVAILLGRSRASEDVDIIIPKINYSTFTSLYTALKRNSFYCLNAEDDRTLFSYLEENLAIRFAQQDMIIPNIELKWEKNAFDSISLNDRVTVKIGEHIMYISPLELQIAFKEIVLQSPKDLEDAAYIKEVGHDALDMSLIQKYREMLHGFYNKKQ